MQTVYGYGRVSHRDQNEVRQVIALEEAGIPAERRFIDKKSARTLNARSTGGYSKNSNRETRFECPPSTG